MDILNFRDLKIKRNTMQASPKLHLNFKFKLKFASHSANLPRSKHQILLTGLQQIGLFALAGAADI